MEQDEKKLEAYEAATDEYVAAFINNLGDPKSEVRLERAKDLRREAKTALRARITELEALVAESREVVKPFVPAANDWNEMGDSRPINMWQVDNRGDYPVTVGMLRRAAALSTKLEAQG